MGSWWTWDPLQKLLYSSAKWLYLTQRLNESCIYYIYKFTKLPNWSAGRQSGKPIRIPTNSHSHTIEIFRINAVKKKLKSFFLCVETDKQKKLATICEKRYKCTCGWHLRASKGCLPPPALSTLPAMLQPPARGLRLERVSKIWE